MSHIDCYILTAPLFFRAKKNVTYNFPPPPLIVSYNFSAPKKPRLRGWGFYILHISCRLLPTCIGSFHVFFICQMCPFPSCMCSLNCSSICHFCLFSTCFLLSHFFCNCHVCLFQIRIFQFHCFCIVSPFFQDVNILDPRTSASRQHKIIVSFFSQMRTEGFSFYFGGLNRSQPPRTSEVRAIW